MNKENWKTVYRYLRKENMILESGNVKQFNALHDKLFYKNEDLRFTLYAYRVSQEQDKLINRTISRRPKNDRVLIKNLNKRKIELYKDDVIDDRMTRLKRK